MSAEIAIFSILSNDSNTNTFSSGGIYADVAEQGQTPPITVYRLTDVTPEPTKDGASDWDKYELEIAAIAKTEEDADTLAGHIKTALDDYTGTANSVVVDRITFQEKRAYYDEPSELYIREQDFTVIVKT